MYNYNLKDVNDKLGLTYQVVLHAIYSFKFINCLNWLDGCVQYFKLHKNVVLFSECLHNIERFIVKRQATIGIQHR